MSAQDDAPCLLPELHEYDDDWPFRDADARDMAPGSKPGDLCVWCLEPKPAGGAS